MSPQIETRQHLSGRILASLDYPKALGRKTVKTTAGGT